MVKSKAIQTTRSSSRNGLVHCNLNIAVLCICVNRLLTVTQQLSARGLLEHHRRWPEVRQWYVEPAPVGQSTQLRCEVLQIRS